MTVALGILGCITASFVHRSFRSTAAPLIVGLMGGFVAATLLPGFVRAGGPGRLTGCKSNLKNCVPVLDMYSTDFSGLYPPTLARLTPNYLKTIPTCPAAKSNTYSEGYAVSATSEAFTVVCFGLHHQGGGLKAPNYPQFSSESGLVERP